MTKVLFEFNILFSFILHPFKHGFKNNYFVFVSRNLSHIYKKKIVLLKCLESLMIGIYNYEK